jgi:carbamoyl-phosphate synthase large subunit
VLTTGLVRSTGVRRPSTRKTELRAQRLPRGHRSNRVPGGTRDHDPHAGIARGNRQLERSPELEALPRDGTLLVQEHLPGAEFSLDVLARADGHVAGVVPRERLKVDSGIAVTGRTLHDDALETFARKVAAAIGLTTVANVQVKQDAAGVPALLEVNPRFPGTMPLTIAAGIDMPKLAIGEALGDPIPDGPLPFQDIAMVRYFEQRFFPFDDITSLQRTAAQISA